MRQIADRGLVRVVALVLLSASVAIPWPAPALGGIATVPPDLAVDDAYPVDEDTVLTREAPGVLENDVTGPTSCATVTDATGLAGQLELSADGSFTFTPNADFHGETSFVYGLRALGAEGCPGPYDDQATVTITVQPVNDAPTAVGDSFQFVWNQTLNIAGPGVLANDGDPDGDDLTAIVATAPVRGHLTLAANGGFSYTPTAGSPCPGTADAFSYRASDGSATSPARVVVLSPAALPCPTPFVSPSPVPPTPSPTPTPTPIPTPTPTPSPTASVEPSPSSEPSASPSPSVEPSAAPSPSPMPSEAPEPVDEEGGVSLPVLLVLVLLAVLLAFGAAFYVPRWVEARRSGGEPPEI